jgi:radial spoke head protein 9
MEIGNLARFLEVVPSQGLSVSQLERIKIECSLRLLQNQMKAEAVFFLGKVLGINDDYYLAFSVENNKYCPSLYYCSQDAVTWFALGGISPELRDEVLCVKAPFTGSLISEVTLPSGAIVHEEQRLAALIADVAKECLLIPRGAVLQTALKFILTNPMWVGLPIQSYRRISNLRHWRIPETELTLLEKTFSNPALDFLPPLADLTEWAFDFSGTNEELKLRSLKWPGFTFYLCNEVWANTYFGTGIAEVNVSERITQKVNPVEAHKTIQ